MRRVTAKPFPAEHLVASPNDLGSYIRAARTQSGLTLEDAALSCGVSKNTLLNIERSPSSVSFGLLLQAATALGVSLFAVPALQQEPARRLLRKLPSEPAARTDDAETEKVAQ